MAKYETNLSSVPGLRQGIHILCGKLGITVKGIVGIKIPGINQNYRDNSRFFRATDGAQVEISKESSIVWVPSGINWNLTYVSLTGWKGRMGRLREGRWMELWVWMVREGQWSSPILQYSLPTSGAHCDQTTALWWGSQTLVPSAHPVLNCLRAAVWFRCWRILSVLWKALLILGWTPVLLWRWLMIDQEGKKPLAQTHKHMIPSSCLLLFPFSFFKNLFIFYWRLIALQNFAIFSQTSTWISHGYTYISSLVNIPPISLPIPSI